MISIFDKAIIISTVTILIILVILTIMFYNIPNVIYLLIVLILICLIILIVIWKKIEKLKKIKKYKNIDKIEKSINEKKQYDYEFRILFGGDACTEKQSLFSCITDDYDSISNIYDNYKFKTINIDNKNIKLTIYNTTERDDKSWIERRVLYDNAIIHIYDITNKKSIENLKLLYTYNHAYLNYWYNQKHLLNFIVGINTDDVEKIEVYDTDLIEYYNFSTKNFKVSSKNKDEVNQMIIEISKDLIKYIGPIIDKEKMLEATNTIVEL
jgi:hypothetical protein